MLFAYYIISTSANKLNNGGADAVPAHPQAPVTINLFQETDSQYQRLSTTDFQSLFKISITRILCPVITTKGCFDVACHHLQVVVDD